ncbi:MAG: hypothetical protein NT031_05895 [Planctomycetota bacterium]|nr:hypothetical protein [Planctomycetota bacterium]
MASDRGPAGRGDASGGAGLAWAGASHGRGRRVLTLPDGGRHSPNNLAYIDSSHLELASSESWRDDGTMGLCLNLMRDGYETLLLPPETIGPAGWLYQDNLFADRLARAGVFISIAPTREFSPAQRKALRQYVENGGIFILTVGYPESGPSRSVLEDFGFSLESADGRAPQTMGHFKAPYVENGTYLAHVRFHAAWPVRSTGEGLYQPIANGTGEKPVILMRKMGKGKVVVIGDTCFAMNKNLEMEGGQPFEGMRENADFWRWFLGYLTDRPGWLPSPPPPPAAPAAQEAPQ